jgi:CTP-dependent riboflavin kinase
MRKWAMVSPDLLNILKTLHDAGASRVPADEIGWTSDMTPTILRALNMQYIISRDTRDGRLFSLTEAGYQALGTEPPNYMSFSRMLRSMLGF